MASGFFYVKKADGTLRPVQDYRLVNKETILDKYGPPRIDGLFDKVKDATIITKLDVRWGYYNIRLREGDEWKAAFRTHLGLFEPTVMFFGLCNAPATFQRFMNDIFRELILEGSVVIYLDDILIFSKDKEEHHRLVKRVFDVLREHKLYLKPEKCEFDRDHVTYLRHIIGNGQIRMDPKNVKVISDWPEPKNVKELQQFLGLGNWLRRFVKDYSAIVRPMTKLTGKTDWQWEEEQRQAFAELKRRLCNPPVLAIPNDEDPFRIETDASDYATGGVLLQKQEGLWKVVAYRSATLHDTERNYQIYDKEMLAIMQALDEWRQYLLGAKHRFEIWTDHANLTFFRSPQKLNRRQARWQLELAEYDFLIVHKPGTTMTKADALSRRPDYDKGENDNENVTLIKDQWVQVRGQVHTSRDELLVKIKEAQQRMTEPPQGVTIMDEIMVKDGKVYVPNEVVTTNYFFYLFLSFFVFIT